MTRLGRCLWRYAEIYTDGACARNGQSGAKAGIGVHCSHDPALNISEPIRGNKHTNQCAELEAATRGISKAKEHGYTDVLVYTDSHYVMKGALEWMPSWKRSGWPRDMINRREFEDLGDAMQGIDVSFEYVPRDVNLADPLARRGANLVREETR